MTISLRWLLQMVKQYWFQLFLVGMVFHLYFNKDISIQVNVRDKNPVSQEQTSWQNTGGQAVLSSMAPIDISTNHATGGPPTFSNLAFILDPNLAEVREVSASIVKENLEVNRKYVERFAKVAISEMKKFQIPASIILAQGLLGSNAGESSFSAKGHNHFQIPCDPTCLDCGCATFSNNGQAAPFRTFNTDWESYREHSLMLGMGDFDDLIHNKSAYTEWAERIEELWYPADTQYSRKLVRIIEALDLYYFDRV
ncbi:MAG: glucosaminidase domain-containing protein [Bacteroidota bacterium]